jgi:cation diffusion facilitator family transporter
MHAHAHERAAMPSLTGWAWLSVGAAVATIGLKGSAYLVTGSVGLLSDALESVVNLVAALVALLALRVASRPPDPAHPFGHGKAEYLSAAVEGLMILAAAALIIYTAVERLLRPEPLEDLGIGLVITVVATVINGVVGLLVLRAGRRHRSLALVADGKHLLTDVWTSIGVVVGVALVALTGWLPLDSLVAIAVAVNILWMGGRIVWGSLHGLMDRSMPQADLDRVVTRLQDIVDAHPGVAVHGIRSRESGRQRFVSMHVLVPGAWTVLRGHDLLELIEESLSVDLPGLVVHTHLEPIEDPRSYEDAAGGLSVGDMSQDSGSSSKPGVIAGEPSGS